MLLAQLHKAVAVAGLQKYQGLAFQFGGFDHVLGKIGTAEAVINEILQVFGGGKEGGLNVPVGFAFTPAQNTGNFAAFQ